MGASMTSFVYDFKDIAQRMKGELKAQPEPELEVIVRTKPLAHWRLLNVYDCSRCEDKGWIEDPFAPPIECNLCCNPQGRPRP